MTAQEMIQEVRQEVQDALDQDKLYVMIEQEKVGVLLDRLDKLEAENVQLRSDVCCSAMDNDDQLILLELANEKVKAAESCGVFIGGGVGLDAELTPIQFVPHLLTRLDKLEAVAEAAQDLLSCIDSGQFIGAGSIVLDAALAALGGGE